MPFWQKLKKKASRGNLLDDSNQNNNNNHKSSSIFSKCSKARNGDDVSLSPESIRFKINHQLTISSTSTVNPDSDSYSPSNTKNSSSAFLKSPQSSSSPRLRQSSVQSKSSNQTSNQISKPTSSPTSNPNQLAELTPILTQNSPFKQKDAVSPKHSNITLPPPLPEKSPIAHIHDKSIFYVSKHGFEHIKPGEILRVDKFTSDFVSVFAGDKKSTPVVIPRNSLLQLTSNRDTDKNQVNQFTSLVLNNDRNLDGSLNQRRLLENSSRRNPITEKLIHKASDLWFHSNIDRQICESRLSGYCDGAFLVRESKNFVGDFVLCVNFRENVQYYRISSSQITSDITDDSRVVYSLDSEDFFHDLESLILHYQSDADGLCCKLTLPVVVQELLPKVQVEVVEVLGAGEFSEVNSIRILTRNPDENETDEVSLTSEHIYAAKCCSLADKWHHSNLLREANTHLMLNSHPNIIECVGICNIVSERVEDLKLTITLENMPRGDLQSILRNNRKSLTRKNLSEFSIDICSALDFMVNKHRIIHRDIASRNVLITANNVAKLADFGMAVPLSAITSDYALNASVLDGKSGAESHDLSLESSDLFEVSPKTSVSNPKSPTVDSNKLPIRWIAPEAYNSHRFSEASDVWSFGVLLWEIYTFGRIPYGRVSTNDLIKKIELEGLRCENFEGMIAGDVFGFMMKSCWSLVPAERFGFARLLQDLETLYLVDFVEGKGFDVVECSTTIEI